MYGCGADFRSRFVHVVKETHRHGATWLCGSHSPKVITFESRRDAETFRPGRIKGMCPSCIDRSALPALQRVPS
jgi:hypothetical protein